MDRKGRKKWGKNEVIIKDLIERKEYTKKRLMEDWKKIKGREEIIEIEQNIEKKS